MKKILIASFDMSVGAVNKSLTSLLNDYNDHMIDLILYGHTSGLKSKLSKNTHLLEGYNTFGMSIEEILKAGKIPLGLARILVRYQLGTYRSSKNSYRDMQHMWKYTLPFLPKLEKTYDIAISYLWPHSFVAEKVEAATKIAWIHTDFSSLETDTEQDLLMWKNFNYIVATSAAYKTAFINKYPSLTEKMVVIEEIASLDIITTLVKEDTDKQMILDQRFKIVTVATLSYGKGVDQAIRALRILRDRGYDIVWYVVGYGGEETMLRKLITAHDLEEYFILLGKRINPYSLMQAADLYVQPSRYGGESRTINQAKILAKPVLVTNYPTAKGQVDNGFDGVICKRSVEGIVNGIEDLYKNDNLREALVNNCLSTDYPDSKDSAKLYDSI